MSKTKVLNSRRYRPVSEFDEATLAYKREYWRTRKREQRARMSQTKTLSKSPNMGMCQPTVTVLPLTNKHVPDIPQSQFTPTFISSSGSYQTDFSQNLSSSCQLTPEINIGPEINPNNTWYETTNLNRAVNQFPESNIKSKKCKSLTFKESNVDASVVKLSGLPPLTKSLPVPRVCVKVHTGITETHEVQNCSSTCNGSLPKSSQQCSVSRITPQYNQQKKPQIKISLPPRSSAHIECKVDVDQHVVARRRANPNRKVCANVPECSTTQARITDQPMTEEEKAAKRRENWRIKKREQRAKRAEKLRIEKERTQCFETGQQEMGKPSCVAPTRPLLSMNTMALREAKQPNSVKSVNLVSSGEKHQKQSCYKHPSGKVDTRGTMVKNQPVSVFNNTNYPQHMKPTLTRNHLALSSVVSLSSSAIPATNQPKNQQQKLMHTQRRQSLPQWSDRTETADERLAKQREYWRIKKRLQRARLSVEMKARLKERDAFKQCTVRYQSKMQHVRKTQTGFQRGPQPNRSMLFSASETSGNFIKEDGTMSISVSKSSAEMPQQAMNCSIRTIKSSLHHTSLSVLHSQKLVCVRTRSVLPRSQNRLNSKWNIPQRSTGQNNLTVNPVVRTKPNGIADADVSKGLTKENKTKQLTQEDKTGYKRKLRSSSSDRTPSSDFMPLGIIKEEPNYPLIESVYSLAEQKDGLDNKEVKPALSPPSETKVEKEVSSDLDSQATTLQVVASMQKLLEESLSSMVDKQTSTSSQDVLLPCKTEDENSLQETETNIKPAVTTQHGGSECKFTGCTDPSIEVKQSPPLCHSPPQAPDFSAEDTVLSCQGSRLQILHPDAAESSFSSQNSKERTHDLSVPVRVRPVHRGTHAYSGRRARFQHASQACGGQQQNERSELQRKREYWRIMKRRQRARKASEKEGSKYVVQHKQLSQPLQRKLTSCQVHHPSVVKPGSHTNLNARNVLPVVTSRPTRLILSPTESNQQSNQPPSNGVKTAFTETSQVKKWQLQTSTLISSSRPVTVTPSQINHVKPFTPQTQKKRHFMINLKTKQNHLKAAANQGLDPEEILRRKRMQWRIKKQEQRARKAARERELSEQSKLSHVGLNLYSSISEVVQSTPPQRPEYQLQQSDDASVKEEAELCFIAADNCLNEPLSEAKWRSTYLMDYDHINQLLVCMVCGEQQYCLSVEGVKGHIEEAHPGTLSLDEGERQRILQAWDEQVAMRERFFTKQLWQQSGALKEENMTRTAEIEVTLDAEDIKQTNKS